MRFTVWCAQRVTMRCVKGVVAACAAFAACSPEREAGDLFGPVESGTPVVDALLVVDQPLPSIYLHRTQPPGAAYSRRQAGISEARVVIREGVRSYPYQDDPDSAGRYNPPDGTPAVWPETTYELQIEIPEGTLKARTHTPGRVRIRQARLVDERSGELRRELIRFGEGDVYNAEANQLYYQDGVVELAIDSLDVPAYQLAVFSLDLDSDFVLEADFLKQDDFEEFERSGSSPPLDFADGTARLPWFAVVFAGRHLFKLHALDQNWFDYTRSSFEGGEAFEGGLAGDNFERPLFSIDGGLGLFGSASVDSVGFFVLPKLSR